MTNHSAKVYRLAYRLTGNKYDAEDLTQEVFVRVFRSLENFKPGTLDGWLHRITTNLFLDQARRKSRIRFDALADDAESRLPGREPGPEQSFEFNNLDVDVQAALEELPPDFRAAVVLCDLEGLSYDEVAVALDIKLGTVRSRIHRGRTMLREKLAHRDPRPAQPAKQSTEAAAQDAAHRRPPLNRSMGLLKRLLGSSGCRFSGRRRRGARRNWAAGPDHVESCAECRARQQRERQYLEKLRGAAVPEASEDLTARLLARTEQLAAERGDAARTQSGPTRHTGTQSGAACRGRRQSGGPQRPPHRICQGPAGRLRAAQPRLPVLRAAPGAARACPSWRQEGPSPPSPSWPAPHTSWEATPPSPLTARRPPPSHVRTPSNRPPAANLSVRGNRSVPMAPGDAGAPSVEFGPDGEPDFTPAGALSAGQLAAFRAHGWTCPELRDLGFHLMWARAGVMSGDKVLELRLTDGRHFATVLEQHVSPPRAPGTPPAPARADASPINVLTGHTAAADGFSRTTAGLPASASEPRNGALWVNPAPPYRAIYQTGAATYTYISDLPADQADDGAAALTRVSSEAPAPASRDGIPERIERGLSRILEHLAP